MINCPPSPKLGTREQILDAARVTLARDGYERITTRRIAQEAGVNIATLHYYFGTKDALLSETMHYAVRWVQEQVHAATIDAPSIGAALDRAFATTLEVAKNNPGILRYDLVVRGFRDADARAEAQQLYASYEGFCAEMIASHLARGGSIRSGLSAKSLARYLTCAIDGVILHYMTCQDEPAAQASLSLIRDHVLLLLDTPLGKEP